MLSVRMLKMINIKLVFVVIGASTAEVPAIREPPAQLLPGQIPPSPNRCASTGEFCYASVDAYCTKTDNDLCFTSASIQQNGKAFALTIDTASRTIDATRIAVHEYTIGDLLLAWGTPTGFSQIGRAIDVYWGGRSASLTTCSFRPDSRVDLITYSHKLPGAAPWRGFVRIKSEDC